MPERITSRIALELSRKSLTVALRVGRLAAVVDGHVAQLGEVAGADVEVDRQAHVLRLVPQRVPVLLGDARKAEGVRLVSHQHALVPAVVGAGHLLNAGLHVPEGHRMIGMKRSLSTLVQSIRKSL